MKHTLLILTLALPLSVFTQNQDHRTEWTMINGDSHRSSYTRMNLEFPLQFKALLQMSDFYESGMSYKGRQLYVLGAGSGENTLVGFGLDSGFTTIWEYPFPGTSGPACFVPTISGNLILGSGQNSDMLYSFTRQTGEPAWFIPTGDMYRRSPIVDETRGFFGTDSVFAVSLLSGETLWTYPEVIPQVSPAMSGDTIYIGNPSGVFALNKWTGDLIWENPNIPVHDLATISVDRERLYIGNTHDLAALHRHSGVSDWGVDLPGGFVLNGYPNGLCLADSHIVIRYTDQSMSTTNYAVIEKVSGNTVAEWDFPAVNEMGPTLINDVVVEIEGDSLFFLNWMTGKVHYAYNFGEFAPAADQIIAADGLLFIGGNGSVIVLEPMPLSSKSPEPAVNGFKCTPNPFSSQFDVNIDLVRAADVRIHLSDARGAIAKEIFRGPLPSGKHQFSAEAGTLPTGNYAVSVVVDRQQVYSEVVVKVE